MAKSSKLNGNTAPLSCSLLNAAPALPGDPGRVLSADTAGVVVACGEQAMRFTTLQKAGGRRLPAGDFLRGFPLAVGDRFASSGD